MRLEPKVRKSLREEIVEDLRLMIMAGHLPAGERIYESRLAEQLEVSRVPVREALTLLEQEGLVRRQPNRGVYVAKLSIAELAEFYSLRSVIEGFAIELAIEQHTKDDLARLNEQLETLSEMLRTQVKPEIYKADIGFHERLVEASHHSLLIHFWRQIISLMKAQFITLLPVFYPLTEDLVQRHRLLLDAIVLGDVEHARETVVDHVIVSGERLLREGRQAGILEQ